MCSGCFRKGEKSMRCQYCGNEMREGALFCSQCGNRAVSQAAPVKKICPNCGEEGAPDMLFCEYCGTRLSRKEDAGAAHAAAGTDTAACSGSGAGSHAAACSGSQGPLPDGAESDVLL